MGTSDMSKCNAVILDWEALKDYCPLKDKCRRYTQVSHSPESQSYIMAPYDLDTETCFMFWEEK